MLWVAGRAARGRDAFVAALPGIRLVSLSEVEWLVGTGGWEAWEALCSAEAATGRGPQRQTTHLALLQATGGSFTAMLCERVLETARAACRGAGCRRCSIRRNCR